MMRFATPIDRPRSRPRPTDRNRYRKEGGRLTFELKATEAREGGGAIYRRLLSAPNFHLSIIFGIVFGISIELNCILKKVILRIFLRIILKLGIPIELTSWFPRPPPLPLRNNHRASLARLENSCPEMKTSETALPRFYVAGSSGSLVASVFDLGRRAGNNGPLTYISLSQAVAIKMVP